MITHFNHTHPEKAILINNKQALSLLDSVNSIKGLQLESSLSKSRAIFDTVTKEVKIGSIKLESTKKHIEELQRQRTSIMQGSMRESDFLQLKGIEEELEKYGIDKKTLENLLSSEEQRLQKISDDIQSDESHLVVVEKDSIALAEISKLYAEGISKYKSEESQAFPFEQEMPQEKEEFSE